MSQMERKFRLKVFGRVWEDVDDFADPIVAGSALIQACEKAGATVPRYVKITSRSFIILADILQILLP